MHNLRQFLACGVALTLAASAGSAFAQAARPTAPAAAAPATIPTGPVIPGVCVFSNEQAIGTSAVGKFVQERLKQIQGQVQAEVQGEAAALQADEKAYLAQRGTLSSDVQQQRELSMQQREQQLQRKAELRNRELQATEQKALSRIAVEMNPLLRQVYSQRNCGLLLDQNAVFGANPAMSITPEVVRLLDAKITQFAFDREHLDQPQAAAGAPAAAAAARPQR